MGKILIVSNIIDPHSDAVINEIINKDSIFRFNTDELLNEFSLEFFTDENINSSKLINPIGRSLNIEEVSTIYYRRPEQPKINISSPFNKVLISEAWSSFFHLLYSNYNKQWLGHPHLDKYASSRVVQLNTANKVGWKIPPTLISKDPKKIRQFSNQHKVLAIKPLGEKGSEIDGQWTPYFTSLVNSDEIIAKSDNEIGATYNYLQAYIEKNNEWRITVIGDEVFPCVIYSQENEDSKIDWRTAHFNSVRHEKAEISNKFKNQLIQYLNYLKIPFGAFDFILTPENEFVFLECNPNGQWLWIEDLTGFKISKSIANWLEKMNNERTS